MDVLSCNYICIRLCKLVMYKLVINKIIYILIFKKPMHRMLE